MWYWCAWSKIRISFNLHLLLPPQINTWVYVVDFFKQTRTEILILGCSEPLWATNPSEQSGSKPAYPALRGSQRYKDDTPAAQSPCTAPICCRSGMWVQQPYIWWLKPALTRVWGQYHAKCITAASMFLSSWRAAHQIGATGGKLKPRHSLTLPRPEHWLLQKTWIRSKTERWIH